MYLSMCTSMSRRPQAAMRDSGISRVETCQMRDALRTAARRIRGRSQRRAVAVIAARYP
jgi:hypothetical protein